MYFGIHHSTRHRGLTACAQYHSLRILENFYLCMVECTSEHVASGKIRILVILVIRVVHIARPI